MVQYTKKELVDDLAELDLIFDTKKAAHETVEFIINKITSEVAAGKQVNLSGLCLFKPATQAARSGKVPGSDQTYAVEAKRVVKITPSVAFKTAVAA